MISACPTPSLSDLTICASFSLSFDQFACHTLSLSLASGRVRKRTRERERVRENWLFPSSALSRTYTLKHSKNVPLSLPLSLILWSF